MAVRIEYDAGRRWVLVHASDDLTLDEMLGVLRSARADAEHQMWPMLVDARATRTSLTEEDVLRAVEAVREALQTQGVRGHVAIVADDNVLFDRLLLYEARCAQIGVRVIRVFRQMLDAERWLYIMSATWKFGETRRNAT
ncbi:MAG TPA: hypothetical protein VFA59_10025 [Vicinamibacterales bacterium]|nr:hypothetical protein [Vicinamibacterales bacterium]